MIEDTKKEKYVRPAWDEYFMRVAEVIAARATCSRGRNACVITTIDNHILTTGYAGAPSGFPHCDDAGHMIIEVIENGETSEHCIRTLHAEQNAILQAAKEGIPLKGATIYTLMFPCYNCAMSIARVDIKRVVARNDYQKAQKSKELFQQQGIAYKILKRENAEYAD